MKLLVAMDHKFLLGKDGHLYSQTMFGEKFWQRYLAVFDSVTIMARPRPASEIPTGFTRVTSDRVHSWNMPFYHGPVAYLRNLSNLRYAVRAAVGQFDTYLLRLPSNVPGLLGNELLRQGKTFAVEMVGDPYELLGTGTIRSPLRRFFQWRLTKQTRILCSRAAIICYVTERMLQRRYPSSAQAPTFGVSDVELETALPHPRKHFSSPCRFITVGSMELLYKGQDILLRAFRLLLDSGVRAKLQIVGDGRHRGEMEELMTMLELSETVEFVGQVPAGEPINRLLDSADVFVLPSRQEGLPRAMVEAMARALPVIGSTVGGIPELLAPEDMVEPSDVKALFLKMKEFASSDSRKAKASAKNLDRARDFLPNRLDKARNAFLHALVDGCTQPKS